VLTDDLGSCGDPEGPKPDAWYAGGYKTRYLPWLNTVVPHFKDSPTIGMWELVNEPGGPTSSIRGFYDDAGGLIHQLDPNHLVESGAHAPWAYGGDAGWGYIHQSPGIDVASLHEYDMNAGASPHLAGAVAEADAIGKPVILGEVGIFASATGDPTQFQNGHPCLSFAARDLMFKAKLDATFLTSIDGVDVWNWMPHDKQSCRLETYPDDPLMSMIRNYPLSN
jgi:endo-1,4-beta-mannosidase